MHWSTSSPHRWAGTLDKYASNVATLHTAELQCVDMCSVDMTTPGAGGHLRAEEAVGAGASGQGHQQHIQALRSQETPENIQGDRDNYNVHMLTWKLVR